MSMTPEEQALFEYVYLPALIEKCASAGIDISDLEKLPDVIDTDNQKTQANSNNMQASAAVIRAMMSLSLCVALSVLSADKPVPPPTIAVVKTWNDLASQPAIELQKNSTARLGIQAVHAKQHSGVMIYCMTEAYSPDDEDEDDIGNDTLGPFHVVCFPSSSNWHVSFQERLLKEVSKRDFGRLVFGHILALDGFNEHTVEVYRGDHVIARVKIASPLEVKAFHTWSALVPATGDIPQDEELETNGSGHIQTAVGRASVPKLKGSVPLLAWMANGVRIPDHFKDDDPLPVLPAFEPKALGPLTQDQKIQAEKWIIELSADTYAIRANASKALESLGSPVADMLLRAAQKSADADVLIRLRTIVDHLDGPFPVQYKDKTFTLKIPVAIQVQKINQYFLARWWVNGKPVFAMEKVIEQKDIDEAELDMEEFAPSENLEQSLKVQMNPKALGAKAGDTVSVQFLFCPDGTRRISPNQLKKLHDRKATDKAEEADGEHAARPERFPVASKKIDFKLP